ncbi:response regulator transcription factor [Aeromonas simiae]|uniref:response regulator transcription factor n=1 Tax=Aeromonas simiae TaxID=218936 RepID=UPI0005A7088C|nr:response regulator transcription factor [Aeromonas simiae]MDO2948720.1 response regulator transcription factor [Aeromonas simiae]MDO2952195.1 response regulator transcription factor [Aeromonas simiae]MDO2956103.1 response regulator transcription factor [Aeromonas simiae]
MKILLVEDNPQVMETILDYLELAGHTVDCAYHGQAALQRLAEQRFDVIIMDVMMPRLDGLSAVTRLREEGIATPVIFLTARDSLEDKLAGFRAGGDDYLVKPFAMEELEVRLQALALRGPRGDVGQISVGDLTLDPACGRAERAGIELRLGKIPFRILTLLARRAPAVVSRQEVLDTIWGDEEPDSDALRSHIYALRGALDKPFDTPMLETVHGQGYRLVAP